MMIDILRAIASKVGFNYLLHDSPDGRVGFYDTKERCGMVVEVNESVREFHLLWKFLPNFCSF